MRFLDGRLYPELTLTKDLLTPPAPYAILSHTWGPDEEEVTFSDVQSKTGTDKAGYAKLRFCAEQARKDGLDYFWVDTCCIDKANHVELSAAITSMFRWYREAQKCYVYLSDMSVPSAVERVMSQTQETAFRRSRWFTRGWTLQELIAPLSVEFFSVEGLRLGDKKGLGDLIHDITSIPVRALQGASLSTFSVDERLQWAEGRQTTKVEDQAYCLLGVFGVFMPLIYGEGRNAYTRLRNEIKLAATRSDSPGAGLADRLATALVSSDHDAEGDTLLTASSVVGAFGGVPPGASAGSSSLPATTSSQNSGACAISTPSVGSPPSKAQQTWNQAYSSILVSNETCGLANAYSSALANAFGPEELDLRGSAWLMGSEGLQDPAERQVQVMTLIQQLQNRAVYASKMTEKIASVARFIRNARADVSEGLRTDPQIALPWVGVSMGLEILMNPLKSHRSNLEGLAYLTSRMRWYYALAEHLLDDDNISNDSVSHEAINNLRISIVGLYKSILLYQMKTACKYYQSQGWNSLCDLTNLYDCDTDLDNIVEAEVRIQKVSDHIASPRIRVHLNTLAQAGAERKARLGEVDMTLKDFVTAQMKRNIDEDEKAALMALYVLDPRYDMGDIEDEKDRLLDEAYNWILDTPEYMRFTNWQHSNSDNVRLMWVKGNAGTGKTMLLIGIIRHLSEQSSVFAPRLAYFFCRGTGKHESCDATACLRSLIWLLLFQQPQLRSHLLSEYKFKGSDMFTDRNAFATLRAIFLNMLVDANFTQAYLVVDALDECSERLDHLLELISISLKTTSKIKWLVSGRPEVDIARLRSTGTLVELDAQRLSAPVAAYIKYKLEDLAERDGYTPQIIAQISEEIKPRAQNTFLWVALVFKELKDVDGWDATGVIKATPPQLVDLYHHVMARISRQKQIDLDRCKTLLATTTLAFRPLSLAELTTVAGLPEGSAKTYVLKCRSFLMIKESDRTVHLIHQSVKEYLRVNFADKLQQEGFHATHLEISRRSRTAIGQLRANIYELPNQGYPRHEIKAPAPDPLASLRYSCVFWGRHHVDAVHEADTSHFALIDCIRFLENSFLVWLECLSLINELAEGIHVIRHLLEIAERQFGHPSATARIPPAAAELSLISRLIELLRDAERFITSHRSIIERAPLQTYASALVFSPTESTLRNLYWESTSPNVLNVNGIGSQWESCLQVLEEHTGYVNTVAFSSDGKSFASASSDSRILLWDSETGCRKTQFSVQGRYVTSVAFAPNNQKLASASSNGTVQLWDLEDDTCVEIFHSDTQWVTEIVFSHPGDILAGALTDSTIQLWNTSTGASQILNGNGHSVNSLAFAERDRKIVSASSDGSVYLWDVVHGTKETLQCHKGAVNSVALSPDEKCIASGSNDKAVSLHWPERSKELWLQGHSDAVNAVAFSPNGLRLASASSDGTLRLWSVDTGICTKLLSGHQTWVNSIAFSPDGKVLSSGSSDRTIRLWETRSEKTKGASRAHGGPVISGTFSSDGELFASASTDRTARLWDAKTGDCLTTLGKHGGSVWAVAFSKDRSLIATGSIDQKVRLWCRATGSLKKWLVGHLGPVSSLCFSPDDKCLLSGAGDWRVRVWDVVSGECMQTLEGHQSWITHVVFSTGGTHIASASKDGKIRLWAPALGAKQLEVLRPRQLEDLIYIPGQANLALLQTKDVVKLWDGHTFACRAVFSTSAQSWALTFSQNDDCLRTHSEHFPFGPMLKGDDHLELPARLNQSVIQEQFLFLSFNYPTFVEAGQEWQVLDQILFKIFSARSAKAPITTKEYISAYTTVYNICSRSPPEDAGRWARGPHRNLRLDDFYKALRDYIVKYLEELVRISSHITGEALLSFYSQEWANLASISRYVSFVFRSLSKEGIKSAMIAGRPNVYEIFDLHLILWYKVVIGGMCERIVTHILNVVDEERKGASIDSTKIKIFVDSLIAIGEISASEPAIVPVECICLWEPEKPRGINTNTKFENFLRARNQSSAGKLGPLPVEYIYLFEMEKPILDATRDFYKNEAERHISARGVSGYLKMVEQRLDEEEKRVRTYLHATTEIPLKRVCTATLVREQSETLLRAFPQFLRDGSEEDMARMYRLLTQDGDHSARLITPFESHLRKAGLASVLEAGSNRERSRFGKLLSNSRVPGTGNHVGVISIKDDWICRGEDKILWLPPDYRPTCAASYGDVLALGHQSGQVTFIELAKSGKS